MFVLSWQFVTSFDDVISIFRISLSKIMHDKHCYLYGDFCKHK